LDGFEIDYQNNFGNLFGNQLKHLVINQNSFENPNNWQSAKII
jgi:hypothetical protein